MLRIRPQRLHKSLSILTERILTAHRRDPRGIQPEDVPEEKAITWWRRGESEYLRVLKTGN